MNPLVVMRRSVPSITVMLLATFWSSCCPKATTHDASAQESILVASGGGFSGAYSGYRLWRDGTLQAWTLGPDGSDSLRTLVVLHHDTTDYLFARIRFFRFADMKVSAPGNLTYVVRIDGPEGSHEARWGDRSYTPPADLARFYDDFLALVKDRLGLRQ